MQKYTKSGFDMFFSWDNLHKKMKKSYKPTMCILFFTTFAANKE